MTKTIEHVARQHALFRIASDPRQLARVRRDATYAVAKHVCAELNIPRTRETFARVARRVHVYAQVCAGER